MKAVVIKAFVKNDCFHKHRNIVLVNKEQFFIVSQCWSRMTTLYSFVSNYDFLVVNHSKKSKEHVHVLWVFTTNTAAWSLDF